MRPPAVPFWTAGAAVAGEPYPGHALSVLKAVFAARSVPVRFFIPLRSESKQTTDASSFHSCAGRLHVSARLRHARRTHAALTRHSQTRHRSAGSSQRKHRHAYLERTGRNRRWRADTQAGEDGCLARCSRRKATSGAGGAARTIPERTSSSQGQCHRFSSRRSAESRHRRLHHLLG
jgi:hypothetical protein